MRIIACISFGMFVHLSDKQIFVRSLYARCLLLWFAHPIPSMILCMNAKCVYQNSKYFFVSELYRYVCGLYFIGQEQMYNLETRVKITNRWSVNIRSAYRNMLLWTKFLNINDCRHHLIFNVSRNLNGY